jgi:uncharacterized membrane protein YfcA
MPARPVIPASTPFRNPTAARVAISAETIRLFLFGLPVLLAGTWLGLKLYGKVNEMTFRKIVLSLLLLSGAALIV